MTAVSHFVSEALVVVLVLGAMIFIHEAGHFFAAKGFGVRVLTFSFGFGKRLFGFKWGDTDCRVSLLPFGGYVKMAGEEMSEAHPGQADEFLSHPRWQRFIIAVMGPVMNILLAVGLLSVLYHYHFPKPAYLDGPAIVGDVDPNSPAAKAGILPGDVITRLGDLSQPKWGDLEMKVLTSPGEVMPVEFERDGVTLKAVVAPQPQGSDQTGYAGWTPSIPAVIGEVEPSLPAAKAGLKPGDRIVALDGQKIFNLGSVARALQSGKGKPADFTILRDGISFEATVAPVFGDLEGQKKWMIGVGFRNDVVDQQLPWGQAIASSLDDNARGCLVTFDVLGKILSRRMSARSLSGPIGIVEMSGQAYHEGMTELLMLVAFISLQLALFNFLPIPVLDGGVILLLLIESVMRRDLSLAVKERFVQVGVAILLLLMAAATYLDLVKTF